MWVFMYEMWVMGVLILVVEIMLDVAEYVENMLDSYMVVVGVGV